MNNATNSILSANTNFNFAAIVELRKQEQAANRDQFSIMLKLAKEYKKVKTYLNSKEGKEWVKENFKKDKKMSANDKAIKAITGLTKSTFAKYCRVAEAPQAAINGFKRECTEAEKRGETPSRGLATIIKYLAAYKDAEAAGEDGEEAGAEATAKKEVVATMSAKGEGDAKGIAVRVYADGTIDTPNSLEELLAYQEKMTALIRAQFAEVATA